MIECLLLSGLRHQYDLQIPQLNPVFKLKFK